MFVKRLLLIGTLVFAGVFGTLAIPDSADARPRYRGGYYGRVYRPYYRSYGYRPYYNYGYRPYSNYYYGSYGYPYRYYGGYGYPYQYYGGYGYPGGGVYVGRGGISIGW